jgi:hypothetical protein
VSGDGIVSLSVHVAGFQWVRRGLTDTTINGAYREEILATSAVQLYSANVEIAPGAQYDSEVLLSDGDDSFEHCLDNLRIAGSYSQVVHGGAGNDSIRVAQQDGELPVAILPGGALVHRLVGDDGDDLLQTVVWYDAGDLSVHLAGGAGNDLVSTQDTLTLGNALDAQDTAAAKYLLEGGEDEDDLRLALQLAAARDAAFTALVDGGPGFDTCRVTPGLPDVQVVNCEGGVRVSTSEHCDNPVDIAPTSELVIEWSVDHLSHSQADPLGCVDVVGMAHFQIRVSGLPANLTLRVQAQGQNVGTATIEGNVVTFTVPRDSTTTDNWTIDVQDTAQGGANIDSAWVKLAYV